jgi:hypothetical protein
VSEGIENIEDLACLRDLGLRYGQGYFMARPGAPFPNLVPGVYETIRDLAISPLGLTLEDDDDHGFESSELTAPPRTSRPFTGSAREARVAQGTTPLERFGHEPGDDDGDDPANAMEVTLAPASTAQAVGPALAMPMALDSDDTPTRVAISVGPLPGEHGRGAGDDHGGEIEDELRLGGEEEVTMVASSPLARRPRSSDPPGDKAWRARQEAAEDPGDDDRRARGAGGEAPSEDTKARRPGLN